jgi:hypothetical protein
MAARFDFPVATNLGGLANAEASTDATPSQQVTAQISAAVANVSGSYGNANVANYLPTYSGQLGNATEIAIGSFAGSNAGGNGVHIGSSSGGDAGANSVSIGFGAALNNQGEGAVAVGAVAGRSSQGVQAVAIGKLAGNSGQNSKAVAIGSSAGQDFQGNSSIAIGELAGFNNQLNDAIAIGKFAGFTLQGNSAIAIGAAAGRTNQPDNSIVINASGANLNGAGPGFFVNPVRTNDSNVGNIAFYNPSSHEFTTSNTINTVGNITTTANVSANFFIGNSTSLTGNVTTTGNVQGNFIIGDGSQLTNLPVLDAYSNANVANYLPTYTGNLDSLTGNVTTTGNVRGNFIVVGSGLVGTGASPAPSISNFSSGTFAANVSANFFIGNGSQLTGVVQSLVQPNNLLYVAKNGNDTTGTGSINAPYLTIQNAINAAAGDTATTIILAPGSYVENLTIANVANSLNITGSGLAESAVNGNITISGTSNNIEFDNFRVETGRVTHSADGYWSVLNMRFSANTGITKTSNTVTKIFNTDLGGAGTGNVLLQAGRTNIYGSQVFNAQISGANTEVNFLHCDTVIIPTVISGNVNFVDSVVLSTGTGNSLNALGGYVVLKNCLSITPSRTYAPINFGAGSSFTYGDSGFDFANTTFAGTAIVEPGQFQAINVRGGNVTTTANISGNFIIGDGSQLTNLPVQPGTYSNTNVANYLPTYSGNIGVLGNLTRISIGANAGANAQGGGAIAIGVSAGNANQGNTSIAIGFEAGLFSHGTNSVAIGTSAGSNAQSANAIAIGVGAGNATQGRSAIAIGFQAGLEVQRGNALAIGTLAGQTSQGANSIAIGWGAGSNSQSANTLAIGQLAGNDNQSANAVAIGRQAGQTNQGANSIAIGWTAGNDNQGGNAVAIGRNAGSNVQGANSVAIGTLAGFNQQGANAVAIGVLAGGGGQGANSISIGAFAGHGNTVQADNSIVLNATGANLLTTVANTFIVQPVRNLAGANSNVSFHSVFYNPTTGEFVYNT